MKVCIVGGVAGGAGAATRLRRLDEQAEIILFERGEHISYANCGLPYYLGGVIKEKESLLVTKPELLQDRFHIDVRIMQEVVSIDRENHKIVVEDKKTGKRYGETYDKLILSPGASPKKFPMEGIDEEGIFTVRSVTDTLDIENYIKNHESKSAMIIGGGFIGVEMAENLKNRGLEVSLVEFTDQIMAPLDKEMANILHGEMIDKGVQLFLGRGAKSFKRTESGQLDVALTDGQVIGCDLVVLAMGVAPESHLAAEAGLDLSVGNSIAVNDQFQTSDPDIYAVGDAIAVTQGISGMEALISLAGPANRQGRSVAAFISGREDNNGRKAIGSSVVKVFDYTAASVGLNEKQLIHMERKYWKTYVHPQSHAVYYPGAMPLNLKMLFDDEGKILGAQAVGIDNVEKQIDVLAAAIQLNGTVWDLERMELCYAPPFNSAKSPVNMLGFTAANILNNDMPVWYAEDLEKIKSKGDAIIIDVSKEEEYLMGTIPYAVNMPLDSLRENLFRLDKNKKIYVTCRVGQRGYIAERILLQNGYQAYNLSGGYKTYHTYAMDIDQLMEKQKKKNSGQPKAENVLKEQKEQSDSGACSNQTRVIEVDACGLQCPGPIMKVSENMKEICPGEHLLIRATDPAFASDIEVWCERTGNSLIRVQNIHGTYEVEIEKGKMCEVNAANATSAGNDKTMVVFSGDLDKAIASFIIANGAAAMDRKVTMFFTFWGLNILRKNEKVKVKKNVIEKMFSFMMPRGSKKLKLSNMNMAGMGGKMIRSLMAKKNVASLEELIISAKESGIRIVACQMSMDLMGIKPEELIDGVEIGGVATFLGSAETSDTNLFI